MKFDELRSIGHNIADSLASGIGLLIGVYEMDIFGEAAQTPEGFISVDFLNGTSSGGIASASLSRAIVLYRDALADLCKRHGTSSSEFKELTVRYWSTDTKHPRFTVAVADHRGHRSVDEYEGVPGRRIRVLDSQGRARRR